MRIITCSPVLTANRIRQLASAYPLDCARALEHQPEALAGVGRALALLAEEECAAEIVLRLLRRRPDLTLAARPFYDRRRKIAGVAPDLAGLPREITTARQRP